MNIYENHKWELQGKEQFELVRNSSYRGKFQWNFDQSGKENLVRVSGEFELSRFYCNNPDIV